MISNRFDWAASVIAPAPSDQILEIGSGTGLLAALIAPELQSGHLVAIDKSAAMVSKAAKKNQPLISNGKMTLHTTAFSEFICKVPFNKIVAFNVNIFRNPAKEQLKRLHAWLLPQGQLFIFYQTPTGIDKKLMAGISTVLTGNGFSMLNSLIVEKEPVRSFCLIATPV